MCIMCKMTNITLSVPDDLKRKMDEHPIINWSEVARQAFVEKIADLEFLREFKSKSELSGKDAILLGSRVSEGVAAYYANEGKAAKVSKLYDELMAGSAQLSDEELVKLGREMKKGRAKKLRSKGLV